MTTSHSISSCSSLIPLNWLKLPPALPQSGSKFKLCFFPITSTRNTRRSKSQKLCARLDDSQSSSNQQQLNLTVLRFTFGIPGLDESYLPRWIGYGFGSLLVLNHFFGSNFATTSTPAQLRTEALGLSLAAFSIALPYLGKFLKGATSVEQATLPEGNKQIFVLSNNIPETQREDLAWATYILLRNTNAIAVLISIQGELCIRGYWKIPDDVSKAHELDWFEKQVEKIGLSDLKDALYFPQSSDSGLWEMLPKGTRSLLVEPLLSSNETEKNDGFVLLASSASYAFSDKDRAWIRAIANKFRGFCRNSEWKAHNCGGGELCDYQIHQGQDARRQEAAGGGLLSDICEDPYHKDHPFVGSEPDTIYSVKKAEIHDKEGYLPEHRGSSFPGRSNSRIGAPLPVITFRTSLPCTWFSVAVANVHVT